MLGGNLEAHAAGSPLDRYARSRQQRGQRFELQLPADDQGSLQLAPARAARHVGRQLELRGRQLGRTELPELEIGVGVEREVGRSGLVYDARRATQCGLFERQLRPDDVRKADQVDVAEEQLQLLTRLRIVEVGVGAPRQQLERRASAHTRLVERTRCARQKLDVARLHHAVVEVPQAERGLADHCALGKPQLRRHFAVAGRVEPQRSQALRIIQLGAYGRADYATWATR